MATTKSKLGKRTKLKKPTVREQAIKNGYKSGLEEKVSDQISSSGLPVKYEQLKIAYRVDELRSYTPDFELPNSIIIETKGRFTVADRMKHLMIQKQHPDKDIRFVFYNSNAKISKQSKTSYKDWCIKNNFKYSDKLIPEEWLNEI